MTADETKHETRRSALLPTAAAFVVFFVTYFGIGLPLEALLPPGDTVQYDLIGTETQKLSEGAWFAGSAGVLSGFLVASLVYARLRYVDPVAVYAHWLSKSVLLGSATLLWYICLFTILWLLTQDGILFAFGVVFGLFFAKLSLDIFATLWRKHTPPFKTGDVNGR